MRIRPNFKQLMRQLEVIYANLSKFAHLNSQKNNHWVHSDEISVAGMCEVLEALQDQDTITTDQVNLYVKLLTKHLLPTIQEHMASLNLPEMHKSEIKLKNAILNAVQKAYLSLYSEENSRDDEAEDPYVLGPLREKAPDRTKPSPLLQSQEAIKNLLTKAATTGDIIRENIHKLVKSNSNPLLHSSLFTKHKPKETCNMPINLPNKDCEFEGVEFQIPDLRRTR